MRYALRRRSHRDAGEPAIIAALKSVGATVAQIDAPDQPDLLVGFRGVNHLLEIKEPIGPKGGTSKNGQQLSEGQLKWHQTWKGQVTVVRSAVEALQAIGLTVTITKGDTT